MNPAQQPAAPAPERLQELCSLARELAVAAGGRIMRDRPDRLAITTKSSSSDVVTQMDSATETFLRQRLAQERPRDAVFGEEGGLQDGVGEITWVLDPIDGTVNYLYGIPEYAVSVAAVVGDPNSPGNWRPVAGAVAHPEAGLVYSAALGQGAWLYRCSFEEGAGPVAEPQRLRPSGADSLDLTLLGTGFGYRADVRRRQAEVMLQVLPVVRDIRRGGSAALDLCSVAAGRIDAYYERGINPWDYAAGWLLVTEAGGVVSGVGAQDPGPNGLIAATPDVHPALRELLERVTA